MEPLTASYTHIASLLPTQRCRSRIRTRSRCRPSSTFSRTESSVWIFSPWLARQSRQAQEPLFLGSSQQPLRWAKRLSRAFVPEKLEPVALSSLTLQLH